MIFAEIRNKFDIGSQKGNNCFHIRIISFHILSTLYQSVLKILGIREKISKQFPTIGIQKEDISELAIRRSYNFL